MDSLSFETGREEFERASEVYDVVPAHAVVDLDGMRPVDALRSLCREGTPSFIFESESPEPGASRYSYVCPLIEKIVRTGETEIAGDINPVAALRSQLASRSVAPANGLPSLVTGVFGFVAYEAIKHFEPSVGELPVDPTRSPVSAMAIPSELLVFDRVLDQLHILVFSCRNDDFATATDRISQIWQILETAPQSSEKRLSAEQQFGRAENFLLPANTEHHYQSMVRKARQAIVDGELIQVVLGQRIEVTTAADPLDIYDHLSTMNPSPYMYMLDLGDMQLIGASPELMMRVSAGNASIHPIAGTRPRGETTEDDLLNEAELLSNEKESAEHVMLVDLARNDLGRVCEAGTIMVSSLKHIERYSHVMHLVSRIEGRLSGANDGIDAFKSGFPIGTLSGAPRIRSIQLIAELEQEGRGPYCGGIGWFGANGDVDTGTIIRSIVLRDGIAHVQGGAGIVFDSDPETENLESLQKTKAPLLAIARAEAALNHGHHSKVSTINCAKISVQEQIPRSALTT